MSEPPDGRGDGSFSPGPDQSRIRLGALEFDPVTEADVVTRVMTDLTAYRGGRIITPNVDILRLAQRDPEAREHVRSATVVVADGAPLVWASRLGGRALPGRVAGSDLIWSLTRAAAEHGRSVYLLGGEPGAAELAAAEFERRFPSLIIAGWDSPPFGFDTRPEGFAEVSEKVIAGAPDIVFVGLGFPKQERVIARLRPALPQSWFLGCGAAIGFVAGTHRRAPEWMRRTGLEWTHRLVKEPRRLARRYLVDGVPFAAALLMSSAAKGLPRRRRHLDRG